MADRHIIQGSISQLGQSQSERAAKELEAGFVAVDERSAAQLLDFTQRFARLVNHHSFDPSTNTVQASPDWARYFMRGAATPEQLLAATDGLTPPQLALFLAFLRLYDLPRATLNRLTDLHLRFQMERVLQFSPRPPTPDRAHVILELKKHTNPVRLLTSHELSAKKDGQGIERVYQPVRESVVNHAKVDQLRTVLVEENGTIRIAPVTNSADGVGAKLSPADPKFAPFGHTQLPTGRVGFAIASPVLRMAEGTRVVTLEVQLDRRLPADVEAGLDDVLEAFITGEKQWLGPYPVTPLHTDPDTSWLGLSFTIPDTEKGVVDLDPAIHGKAIAGVGPVAQIHLKPRAAGVGYRDLASAILRKARASVSVTGVTSLQVENDAGRLDPKKPFTPFGTQPIIGSRFFVGGEEILSKDLTQLKLKLEWHGLPSSFSTHYANYGDDSVDPSKFTASVVYEYGSGTPVTQTGVRLFADSGATISIDLGPTAPVAPARRSTPSQTLHALRHAGSVFASEAGEALLRASPELSDAPRSAIPSKRPFVTLSLERDFLHATYRKVTLENAIGQKRDDDDKPIILNEPYAPVLRVASMDYVACTAAVSVESWELIDFADPSLQFFHVDAFGARREHGWLRKQLAYVSDKTVPLVPTHADEGELLVGVTGVAAGDSVNLLFQVAEGSADPDVNPPEILWSALCDNHWKRLGGSELVLDTTNRLLRSGLIGIVVPSEATTENTLLERGRIWLKAAVHEQTAATSRLLAVLANGAEVEFRDRGNDPHHLDVPLAAGTIAKLRTPIAAIKTVEQPYASFGGRMLEASAAMITRASERLRHKNRCITPWDYERVVLEAFPRVHKVKCLPHAKEGGRWLAPGHVLLVVVPDLRNDNARDPLEPRVDADTLSSIRTHVQARCGMQVIVGVKNPTYQKVRLNFKLKLHRGYEANEYANALRTELTTFLSPWAFDADVPISFGGVLYRSVLLNFVEERPYVDYVTDFKLYSYSDAADPSRYVDVSEVKPRTPDAILVSDSSHDVEVLP